MVYRSEEKTSSSPNNFKNVNEIIIIFFVFCLLIPKNLNTKLKLPIKKY